MLGGRGVRRGRDQLVDDVLGGASADPASDAVPGTVGVGELGEQLPRHHVRGDRRRDYSPQFVACPLAQRGQAHPVQDIERAQHTERGLGRVQATVALRIVPRAPVAAVTHDPFDLRAKAPPCRHPPLRHHGQRRQRNGAGSVSSLVVTSSASTACSPAHHARSGSSIVSERLARVPSTAIRPMPAAAIQCRYTCGTSAARRTLAVRPGRRARERRREHRRGEANHLPSPPSVVAQPLGQADGSLDDGTVAGKGGAIGGHPSQDTARDGPVGPSSWRVRLANAIRRHHPPRSSASSRSR